MTHSSLNTSPSRIPAGGLPLLLDLIGAPPTTLTAFEQQHFAAVFKLRAPPRSNHSALNSAMAKIRNNRAFAPAAELVLEKEVEEDTSGNNILTLQVRWRRLILQLFALRYRALPNPGLGGRHTGREGAVGIPMAGASLHAGVHAMQCAWGRM